MTSPPRTVLGGGTRRRERRRGRLRVVLLVLVLAVLAVAVDSLRAGPEPARDLKSSTPPGRAALTPHAAQASPPPKPAYADVLAPATQRVHPFFKRPPRAGLLWDIDTGRVLWQRHPARQLRIASLTKMMTAILVSDGSKPTERVRITKQALAYHGSGVGVLPKHKRVSIQALLYGLLLPSGNDAAIALAQHEAGTVAAFVRRMNRDAHTLRLDCTRFSSPSGFTDKGNYSCAHDLARLAREVLRRPRIAKMVRTRRIGLPFPIKGGKLFLYNNNPLLVQPYKGTIGVKTGFTDAAGACLVAAVHRGHRRLGVVLLHSYDPGSQARRLFDLAFRHRS